MTSIEGRLSRLEKVRSVGTTEAEIEMWRKGLERLSIEQLDRIEVLYLNVCDHPEVNDGLMMTWERAVTFLPDDEAAEMTALFRVMYPDEAI